MTDPRLDPQPFSALIGAIQRELDGDDIDSRRCRYFEECGITEAQSALVRAGDDLLCLRHATRRPDCLPGCDRLDGHDGRDPGACMLKGIVLSNGRPCPHGRTWLFDGATCECDERDAMATFCGPCSEGEHGVCDNPYCICDCDGP